MKRNSLFENNDFNKGYWTTKIQIDLFNQIQEYLKKHKLSRTEFAKEINVSKGYVTQLLNGDYDNRISKWVELSLAIGKIPFIEYRDFEECKELDSTDQLDKKVSEAVFIRLVEQE